MRIREGRGRPVELALAALLLAGLGLFAGFAGMFQMDQTPVSALATVFGVLVAVLAGGAWFGSASARTTLLVLLLPLTVLALLADALWVAVPLLVAGALLAGSPRVRDWYRVGSRR